MYTVVEYWRHLNRTYHLADFEDYEEACRYAGKNTNFNLGRVCVALTYKAEVKPYYPVDEAEELVLGRYEIHEAWDQISGETTYSVCYNSEDSNCYIEAFDYEVEVDSLAEARRCAEALNRKMFRYECMM